MFTVSMHLRSNVLPRARSHKKYEFGCKVSVTVTFKECFILSMKAYHGNPYDGRTLEESIAQTERISGFKANDI